MEVTLTAIPGVIILKPKRFGDQRGYFTEVFNARRYSEAGIRGPFLQDNLSHSTRGVLRGLHFQQPDPQAKLVSAMRGAILDVAVDVRVGSPTFGRHVAVMLSEDNGQQLFVPQGFAHGFIVLSDFADVFYKCDAFYCPQNELVIRWDDPSLAIDWRLPNPILAERDKNAPLLAHIRNLPSYTV